MVPSNQWSFVALVLGPGSNGGTIYYATNSTLVSYPLNWSYFPPAVATLFTNTAFLGNNAGNYFNGAMDEVAIFDKALTSAQIGDLVVAAQTGVPFVVLTAPTNGSVFNAASNITLTASVTTIGGVSATNIAKWDGSVWSALASGVGDPAASFGWQVNALTVDAAGNLYAGGSFTNAGAVAASNIAKWGGGGWSALSSGTDGAINALAVDGAGNIYAGGAFANAGGVQANNIAGWDGQTWWSIGSGVTGFNPVAGSGPEVSALAFDPAGNLYVGGSFTNAGNQVSTWLAKALVSPQSYGLALTAGGGGTKVITGLGTPGITYVLEATAALEPPVQWTPVATNIPTTQQIAFTNLTTGAQGFYRVRSEP